MDVQEQTVKRARFFGDGEMGDWIPVKEDHQDIALTLEAVDFFIEKEGCMHVYLRSGIAFEMEAPHLTE